MVTHLRTRCWPDVQSLKTLTVTRPVLMSEDGGWTYSFVGSNNASTRIALSDVVSIKPDASDFRKDKKQTGKVTTDDGSSNPYKVRWGDGTESSWLEPQHLEKVPCPALHLDGVIGGDQTANFVTLCDFANIKDGDIIGLVVYFSSRKIEFSKKGQKQGVCCISQDVKDLYHVTAFGRFGDKV